jgi:hypothetical protein
MDGFRAYRYYIATKLHFTTDKFNVFENPNVKGSRDAFSSRNDRYIFEKLARKFPKDFDLIQYYVANFAYGNDAVIYSGSESDTNYLVWQKRKQSFSRVIENDLFSIILHLEKERKHPSTIFKFNDENFPELFKLYLGKHVTIETMVVLNDFLPYLSSWKDNANLLWEEECRRIEKCKGFVKYEHRKMLSLMENFTTELKELENGTHIS